MDVDVSERGKEKEKRERGEGKEERGKFLVCVRHSESVGP